ncbi:LOW QUALITY PROTEIN: uncharacterized protein LOC103370353 [Stegastes partitus]|uniref:LOW QUALITY PROTEIN: uncharacterized protein LOC103370353 n=1 Tax=Stegastes partitus TaxID=144197 RepID=A0AC58RK73_9TELE
MFARHVFVQRLKRRKKALTDHVKPQPPLTSHHVMLCHCEDAHHSDGSTDSTKLIMDYSQPFSVLNQRLKPRYRAHLISPLNEVDETQVGSLRSRATSQRQTVMPTELDPKVSLTKTEDPEEAGKNEYLVSDDLEEEIFAPLPAFTTSSLLTEMNLTDAGEGEMADDDSSTSQSEDKDSSGELASEDTRDSAESGALTGEGGSSFQRSYFDGTLPDLIKSGRPLGRRRTLGHVSETLKEVRREVELSRRRSIKLKAQVDKLQENRDGPGWSQHRERVTEEVLSILRLLHPLTEPETSQPEPSGGENCLDAALAQLQNVARKLAISQTKQDIKPGKKGAEDSAILQQALRDRDEAIEKKKAMEAELLRSKTELMALNNQLLEAVQKRLELSLEVEAWKEDIQRILQQQVQSQQQAEQAQKKTSRLGILRRNKQPIQRPPNFPLPTPPTTNTNQIFFSRSAAPAPSTPSSSSTRWKMRRGKSSRQGDQDSEFGCENDGFQVVSLD